MAVDVEAARDRRARSMKRGVTVRLTRGVARAARLKVHAAEMREKRRPRPRPLETPISEWKRLEIALGLLRLQQQGILRVWIDELTPIVAPFEEWRTPGVTRAEDAKKVSWTRAAQIVERGSLD